MSAQRVTGCMPPIPVGVCRWAFGLALVLALPICAPALDPGRSVSQYARDDWRVNDGLPDGDILCIRQTRDGYLWLATQRGLARFDGARFTLFDAANTRGLPSNLVLSLTETTDDALWLALAGGVARLKQGTFTFFGEEQGLRHPYARVLVERPEGRLWVATGGSGVWELAAGRFTQLPAFATGRLPLFVDSLVVDPTGALWAASNNGVVRVAAEGTRVFTVADGLPSDIANVVLVDRRGTLWAGTRGGLARFEGGRFRAFTTRDGLSHDHVRALADDRDGNLWIGTLGGGLSRLTDGTFSRLDQAAGLSDNRILSLHEDRDGSLWVGTGAGLNRLRAAAFTPYGRSDGLPDEDVFAIQAVRDGSVLHVDSRGAALRLRAGHFETLLPPGTFSDGVPSFCELADGSVFLSGRALYRLRGSELSKLEHRGRELTALAPDGDGVLLAERQPDGALALLRFHEGRFAPIFPELRLPFVHVHGLRRDSAGRIWISTEAGGLHVLEPSGAHRILKRADGLPHDTCYSILEVDDAVIVATRLGLVRVRDGRVFSFGARHGLPEESLFSLVADGIGGLWATSDAGVFHMRLADLNAIADGTLARTVAERYEHADGLPTVAMSWRTAGATLGGDGRVWFATRGGLAVVDPRHLPRDARPPDVYVERLRVGGHAWPIATEAILPPGSSRIEIEYTGLSLLFPRRVEFRYRLEGYESEWVDAAGRRSATYTNLSPGGYEFQVKAANGDGVWNDRGAALRFRIRPHWYQTAPARIVGLAFLPLVALLVHRLRVRQLKARERELSARVAERTRELEQEVRERQGAEAEARRLAEQLEARVRERTAELEDANRRLAWDILERERGEEALSAEKERLAVTLRSIGDGVIATDTEGRLALINRAAEQLTGWDVSSALGQPLGVVFRIVEPGSRRVLPDPALEVLQQGVAPGLPPEALLVARDGRELLVADSAAPIRDQQSRIVGVVLVFRDITERRKLDEHLGNAQRLESLAVLAGGIAHDFNNLLTGILGYVNVAERDADDPGKVRQTLKNALSVMDRARGLTRQLLTFTRAGQPVRAPTDLEGLLRSSARFVLSGSNVDCDFQLPIGLWPCQVDAQQMGQVVDNILLNARQAMPGGGTITVAAENVTVDSGAGRPLPSGRYVRLSVRDQGPGIPRDLRPRVFEPFFTTKPTGTGLGLATAHSIVRRHGGLIDLESEPGAGAAFFVYLPAAEARPLSGVPQAPAGVSCRERGGVRILVVDDEEYVRDVARESLTGEGYNVELASNDVEAYALFESRLAAGERFDLVILDLTMPGSAGGVAILERLRVLDAGIHAVASSGYSSDPVISSPEAFGFTCALAKPYGIDELVATVDKALAPRDAEA
jgi:PAS domain S-box-containing protein